MTLCHHEFKWAKTPNFYCLKCSKTLSPITQLHVELKQVDQPGSGFFKLPTELRLMIFRRVVHHDGTIHDGWSTKNRSPMGLLLCCRSFYSEALPLLYGENRFRVDVRGLSGGSIHILQRPLVLSKEMTLFIPWSFTLMTDVEINCNISHLSEASLKKAAQLLNLFSWFAPRTFRIEMGIVDNLERASVPFLNELKAAFHPSAEATIRFYGFQHDRLSLQRNPSESAFEESIINKIEPIIHEWFLEGPRKQRKIYNRTLKAFKQRSFRMLHYSLLKHLLGDLVKK